MSSRTHGAGMSPLPPAPPATAVGVSACRTIPFTQVNASIWRRSESKEQSCSESSLPQELQPFMPNTNNHEVKEEHQSAEHPGGRHSCVDPHPVAAKSSHTSQDENSVIKKRQPMTPDTTNNSWQIHLIVALPSFSQLNRDMYSHFMYV